MTLQFSPGRHPRVWLTCMQLPAVYLLWCQCTAELHLLNDMYTRQWHINWEDNSSMAEKVFVKLVYLQAYTQQHIQQKRLEHYHASFIRKHLISACWQLFHQTVFCSGNRWPNDVGMSHASHFSESWLAEAFSVGGGTTSTRRLVSGSGGGDDMALFGRWPSGCELVWLLGLAAATGLRCFSARRNTVISWQIISRPHHQHHRHSHKHCHVLSTTQHHRRGGQYN